MIKARAWPVRAMYMLIAAALAIGLLITAAPAQKVSGACTADVCAEWTRVSTPTLDGWVLAPDSVIHDYALASAGDVAYAIVEGYDETYSNWDYRLLKSEDGAATWTDLTDALEAVIDVDGGDSLDTLMLVATDWADPDFVAVALTWWDNSASDYLVSVFFSTDGGDTFIDTGEVEDGGVYFSESGPDWGVSDLVVSPEADGKRDIAIAGQDDSSNSALFRCTVTGDSPGAWQDATAYPGWDVDKNGSFTSDLVTDLIFSPNWDEDRTILAVTILDLGGSPPTDYWYARVHLQAGAWGKTTGNWNLNADFENAAIIKEYVYIPYWLMDYDARSIAGVALPEDYLGTDPDSRYAWVWVNYYDGSDSVGEILRVRDASVDAVDTQISDMPWLTNVSYLGYIAEGKAIAGVLADSATYPLYDYDLVKACCEGVQVYRNAGIAHMEICCLEWDEACKPPTGRMAMAVSYVSEDKAYAVALGEDSRYIYIDEGAWSVSFDDGDTWNQLSLVDTDIDYVSDVAVSPDCNKTMLVTVNILDNGEYCECDSVWLYADSLPEAEEYSGKWLRTWCGELEGANGKDFPWGPERGLLRLAPEETTGDTVYLVDRMSSTIYYNDLETLSCWKTRSSTAGGIDYIVDLAVKDESTIYALDYNGDVAMSDDHGSSLTWTDAVDSEVDYGWTIAVRNSDVLVGGRAGDVSYSDDGGATFTALEDVYAGSEVHVTVAFDTYFNQNDTIYAALANAFEGNGIYLWVIGTSEKWHKTSAAPLNYTGLVLDRPSPANPMTSAETGGVLYASFFAWWDSDANCDSCDTGGSYCWYSGVARCLTPITELCCGVGEAEWDYLTWGLVPMGESYPTQFTMPPQALKICGCLTADSNSKLFAIDGNNAYYDMVDGEEGTVWTFEDCYAKKAVDLTSPADGTVIPADPCYCENRPFTIKWDRLCDACCYEIELAYDEDFTELVPPPMPDGIAALDGDGMGYYYCPDAPMNPSEWIPSGLECEFTYYWRVRTIEAETCQEIHSWWSEPQSFTIAPSIQAAAIDLVSPVPGATDVAIKNVGFSWNLLATADAFDWVLSTNANLSSPVDSKTVLNATACTCTKTLAYGTTYYWKVIAYNDGAAISSSAVGTFTTAPTGAFCCPQCGLCFDTQTALQAHIADAHPAQPATPFWVWVVIAIGAVLVIVVIVLIFRTRRV
jgi:hypothetical protein